MELFELLGDMFVVLCMVESASDIRIVGFVWIEIVSTGYLEGDKKKMQDSCTCDLTCSFSISAVLMAGLPGHW